MALVQNFKDFFTTDGEITKKGLLTSTALGGFYIGLPLYLGLKKIGTIRNVIDNMQTSVANQISTYKAANSKTDLTFKEKLAALNTKATWKVAGVFAIAAAGLGVGNHFASFENPNYNRLSHYGPGLGILGNAGVQAAKKSADGTDKFWSAYLDHLWYKTTDLGAETVKGAISTVDNTVKFAKATGDTAVYVASKFADDNDAETKAINAAKPLSEKFVTVCINRSDFSNPLNDAQGNVTWKPKANVDQGTIKAYVARLDTAAEEFKKPDSKFRQALKESAAGMVITESYVTDGAKVEVKPGIACSDPKFKEYRYNAENYLGSQGKGHTPPNPIVR